MYDKLHNLAGYHKLLQAVSVSGSESGLALFLLSVPNMLQGTHAPTRVYVCNIHVQDVPLHLGQS